MLTVQSYAVPIGKAWRIVAIIPCGLSHQRNDTIAAHVCETIIWHGDGDRKRHREKDEVYCKQNPHSSLHNKTSISRWNVSLSECRDKLAWIMPSEKKRRLQYQRKASVVLCLCKNGVYHGCPSLIICFFVFLPHLLSYTVTPNHKKKEDATSLGFAFVSLRSA